MACNWRTTSPCEAVSCTCSAPASWRMEISSEPSDGGSRRISARSMPWLLCTCRRSPSAALSLSPQLAGCCTGSLIGAHSGSGAPALSVCCGAMAASAGAAGSAESARGRPGLAGRGRLGRQRCQGVERGGQGVRRQFRLDVLPRRGRDGARGRFHAGQGRRGGLRHQGHRLRHCRHQRQRRRPARQAAAPAFRPWPRRPREVAIAVRRRRGILPIRQAGQQGAGEIAAGWLRRVQVSNRTVRRRGVGRRRSAGEKIESKDTFMLDSSR